jgi:hypothetical protein
MEEGLSKNRIDERAREVEREKCSADGESWKGIERDRKRRRAREPERVIGRWREAATRRRRPTGSELRVMSNHCEDMNERIGGEQHEKSRRDSVRGQTQEQETQRESR